MLFMMMTLTCEKIELRNGFGVALVMGKWGPKAVKG
jgi:hypothetical protein